MQLSYLEVMYRVLLYESDAYNPSLKDAKPITYRIATNFNDRPTRANPVPTKPGCHDFFRPLPCISGHEPSRMFPAGRFFTTRSVDVNRPKPDHDSIRHLAGLGPAARFWRAFRFPTEQVAMKHPTPKSTALALRNSLSRIWALLRNEIESLLKDKQSLMIIFLLPLAVMIPFKFVDMSADSADSISPFQTGSVMRFGVLDFDTTDDWPGTPPIEGAVEEDLSVNFSRTFHFIMAYGTGALSAIDNSTEMMNQINQWFTDYPNGTFDGMPSTNVELVQLVDRNQGLDLLASGGIVCFLIIPYGFEHNITNRVPAEITLVDDATETATAATLVANLEITIAAFKLVHNLIRDEIFPIPHTIGKASDSPLFDGGPFIFALLIFGSGILLASQCIVGDEPLRRTLLTPAGKLEVILAKTGALSAIHAVQVQLLLLVAHFGFELPILGNFLTSFLIIFMEAFCGVMIGMFISVVSKTRLQANQFFLLVFIIFLLALIFITTDEINRWMPMYQGVDGFTTYAYKGFDFALQPWPITSISILSGIFFVLTIVAFYFKKTIE